MTEKKQELLAVLGLIIVTFLWGFGFVSLKYCENIPPFLLISLRFIIALFVLVAIFFKKLKGINKELVTVSFFAGLFIFLCYACATIGIRYTTPSRNAFFTCMEAIVVPFINLLIFRIVPKKKEILCVILCFLGIFLISMGHNENIGLSSGDFISFFASVTYACELIILNRYGKKHDPILLTIVQIFFIAVISILMTVIMRESFSNSFSTLEISHIIFLGLGSTAIAFVLQTVCLKHITSQKGALVLTIEPVLGAIFCAIVFRDYLGINGYIGGLIIFLSILISESNVENIFKKDVKSNFN